MEALGRFILGTAVSAVGTQLVINKVKKDETERRLKEERALLNEIHSMKVDLELEQMKNRLMREGRIKSMAEA